MTEVTQTVSPCYNVTISACHRGCNLMSTTWSRALLPRETRYDQSCRVSSCWTWDTRQQPGPAVSCQTGSDSATGRQRGERGEGSESQLWLGCGDSGDPDVQWPLEPGDTESVWPRQWPGSHQAQASADHYWGQETSVWSVTTVTTDSDGGTSYVLHVCVRSECTPHIPTSPQQHLECDK